MKTSVKSKKQIALLSAGALLSLGIAATAGGLTASAAEITQGTNEGNQTVQLKYQQASTWTVTLPDSITVGTAEQVSASGNLADGETLTVTVKGTDASAWKLTEKDGTKEINYQLKKGSSATEVNDDVTAGGTILTMTSSSGKVDTYIKAEVEGNKSTGGKEYNDTLTFHAEVAQS